MTLVVNGDEQEVEQITKQLHKLIDVSKVQDYMGIPIIARELALIKVNAPVEHRTALLQLVEVFRGRVIDMSEKTFVIELTGGGRQDRRLREAAGGLRHPRAGPHRPHRNGARRPGHLAS